MNIIKNKILILSLILLFYVNGLLFADIKFVATVDKNPIAEGDRFQVSFTINNGTGTNFTPPQFSGFANVWGPSHSSNMQIINGVMSQSISYVYTITAGQQGTYTIGPASIKANGKEYKTNSLTIKVVKGNPQSNTSNQKNQPRSFNQQAQDFLKDRLLIKLSVSKRSVYVGEQLVATYRLFYKPDVDLVGITSAKIPTFNNFWSNEIDLTQQQKTSEIIDGVQYLVQDLKKFILVPQKSGNLKLDPLELDIVVRLAVRSSFWPTYENYTYKLKSSAIDINAIGLPSNAPPNFTGIVGNYTVDAKLDRNNTVTNDPVKLRIEISGSGNFKLLDAPTLDLPPDIEAYPPNISDNWSLSANGYSGSKVFEYLLLPKNPGEFKLNPLKFVHFDIDQRQYISYISPEMILKVEKGSGTVTHNLYSQGQENVKLLSQDIDYIRDAPSTFIKRDSHFFNSSLFYILLLSPLVLFILFVFIKNKQEKLYGDKRLLKNKKALKIARNRLTTAKAYLVSNSDYKFYEEVSTALWHYISDKLSISFSDLSKENIVDILRTKNLNDDKINSFVQILELCEVAMFSPEKSGDNMENVYNSAIAIISAFEGELK